MKEMLDLLGDPMQLKAEWKSVQEECGAVYVMTSGDYRMLKWCAGNWDMQLMVYTEFKLSLKYDV